MNYKSCIIIFTKGPRFTLKYIIPMLNHTEIFRQSCLKSCQRNFRGGGRGRVHAMNTQVPKNLKTCIEAFNYRCNTLN